MQAYLDELKTTQPKATPISFKATAEAGVLKDAFIIYGQLSSDAAHPSAESLSRHLTRNKVSEDESILTVLALPQPNQAEVLQTLEFACSALLGICVGANQIIGGLPSGKKLAPMFEEFLALRKSSVATVKHDFSEA